jgi:DNA mismatch repair protein MutL
MGRRRKKAPSQAVPTTHDPRPTTGRIHVLDKAVAERIAAGEVVDRPASVVKELIENSLDAGASRINVEIEGGGIELIRVGDDGTGIHPDDVPLAVERFATSKVATAEDLLAIRTLGFRGEALPSIAAVSHLEIVTAAGTEPGRRLRMSGGASPAVESVGAPAGTTVTVRQLFFNTPARRKFLKSPSREFALITEVVNRVALANPAVAFRLAHEGKDILRYAAGTLEDRVAAVLGGETFAGMIAFQHASAAANLTGWVGRPELARAGRRQQYLYVNRRPVANRVMAGAVEQAYQQLLPAGRFPLVVLFADFPVDRLDINIHPRKMEVRFDDDHRVFGVVTRATRAALLDAQLVRSIDHAIVHYPMEGSIGRGLSLGGDGVGVREDLPAAVDETGPLPAMRLLGQVYGTYLLAQSADGLLVIDQHAAHERVLYERLLSQRAAGAATGQILVTPIPVELDAWQIPLLRAHREALELLGYTYEEFGERTLLLRMVPQIASRAPAAVLKDLLTELAETDQTQTTGTLVERLTIGTACHSAIRAGDVLTMEQMVALVQDLGKTDDPYTCFHGRPTLVSVPLTQLDRWFLRR